MNFTILFSLNAGTKISQINETKSKHAPVNIKMLMGLPEKLANTTCAFRVGRNITISPISNNKPIIQAVLCLVTCFSYRLQRYPIWKKGSIYPAFMKHKRNVRL